MCEVLCPTTARENAFCPQKPSYVLKSVLCVWACVCICARERMREEVGYWPVSVSECVCVCAFVCTVCLGLGGLLGPDRGPVYLAGGESCVATS